MNVASGFILMSIENGSFSFPYSHENNNPLDRTQFVCTKDDLMNLKGIANKTVVIGLCSREKFNTDWQFYKMKIVTVFAALLKDVPMCCKDVVLPETLQKNHTATALRLKRIQESDITTT